MEEVGECCRLPGRLHLTSTSTLRLISGLYVDYAQEASVGRKHDLLDLRGMGVRAL